MQGRQGGPVANTSTSTSTLCPECSNIDLLAIFEGKDEHQRIIVQDKSVRAALETDCALCQLIYRSVARANAHHDSKDRLQDPNLTYILFPEKLQNEGSETKDYWRVSIVIGIPVMNRRYHPVGVPVSLDMLGRVVNSSNPRHIMTRKHLQKSFDIADLKTWLAVCDQNHKQKPQLSANGQAAWRRLLSSNRFRLIDVREKRIVVASEECRFFALSYVWGDAASCIERYSPYEASSSSKPGSNRRYNV